MKAIDFQSSISNASQIDRFSQDVTKVPAVFAETNLKNLSEEVEARMHRPNEVEDLNGRNVDAEGRKKEKEQQKKHTEKSNDDSNKPLAHSDSGLFVDFTA